MIIDLAITGHGALNDEWSLTEGTPKIDDFPYPQHPNPHIANFLSAYFVNP